MPRALQPACILVVDDSPETLEVLERNLATEGYDVSTCLSVPDALRFMNTRHVDLVITDLKMPRVGGLDLVRYVRENLKDTQVMMITGYASVDGAVEAVKAGAEEYLAKPFTDEELLSAVGRCLQQLRLRTPPKTETPGAGVEGLGIVGQSRVMRNVFRSVKKAAVASATVLITGESGTGKELVARGVHYSSPRAAAPFVPVNCGAIPDGLIERELFGHLKGAFTGATEARAGLFHAADGGTIFLDEISEMSLAMQVRLLRVLEDKQVWMVGSNRPRKTDVRVVAATNIDLPSLVRGGAFREDLFYRLNVIPIAVPALRDRGEDILLLARHFATRYATDLGKPVPRFSNDVLRILQQHHWPGNVRELENVVQQLVVMADEDVIDVPDLPAMMRYSIPKTARTDQTLAQVEAEHIANVLSTVGGNKTRAAEILGIDRKTLREKLKVASRRCT
jgi:DNA-binding NtrC family response regulator